MLFSFSTQSARGREGAREGGSGFGGKEKEGRGMGEGDGYKPWWAIDKAAWREKFAVVYKLKSISEGRDQPLPPWSEKDVEEFQNSDPVYGPQLKLVLTTFLCFLHHRCLFVCFFSFRFAPI